MVRPLGHLGTELIRTMNFVIRSQRNSIDIALFAPPEVLLILSQVLFRDICLKSDIADASSDKKQNKNGEESQVSFGFSLKLQRILIRRP